MYVYADQMLFCELSSLAFVLKCLFETQKGAFKAIYNPLLCAIFPDTYKLDWSDPLFPF